MRIVALSPSVTEILFAIGAGNEIIANTSFCDYPEKAKKIPKIGSWIYVDDKKIKLLKPDLVVTSTIVQDQAKKRYQSFRHIHLDPRCLDDIYQNILLLGLATNHNNQAKRLVTKLQNQAKKLMTRNVLSRRIYIEEWFNPPMISGNWTTDIVNMAGGTYYPEIKPRQISRFVTLDEIGRWDPEVIFISYCGFKDKSDPDQVLKRKGWEKISAVLKKRVFVLNDDLLNRPGPRIINAATAIQQVLKSLTADYIEMTCHF